MHFDRYHRIISAAFAFYKFVLYASTAGREAQTQVTAY